MAKQPTTTTEVRKSPAEIRAEMKAQQEAEAKFKESLPARLPPGVEPDESKDPKENPKVGPQDLTTEERADLSLENPDMGKSYGYIEGERVDQMDGAQAAHWNNDLDVDEQVQRNIENPPNLDRADYLVGGQRRRFESTRTQEEMDAGKRALEGRRAKATARERAGDSTVETTPATTLTSEEHPRRGRRAAAPASGK